MKLILLKPFEKYSEYQLLIFGTIALLIGSYISSFCFVNFDGAIDLHFMEYQLSFMEILTQNLINISVLFLCMYLAGMYRYKKTRSIDILNVVLISRAPFYFLALFNLNQSLSLDPNLPVSEITAHLMDNLILFIAMTLTLILVIVWMFALLYNGYKIATNAKGNLGLPLFIAAIVVAEIITKLIINKAIL
jgi:hypothetical protein